MRSKPVKLYGVSGLTIMAMLVSLFVEGMVYAQSADALIEKLVEKGILTVKEANELREEADKNFTQAYTVKSGLPEWVTALSFSGDFRGRYEGFYGENSEFVDRDRFRYRLRFGATAVLRDHFEVGLRLTSGEETEDFGGDPISGNTSFSNNGSKKFIFLDLVYARWSVLNTPQWSAAMTFGKMENVFGGPSTMVFDRDYTPEGLAAQVVYTFSEHHKLSASAAGYVLDELSASSHDPYLLGTQLRWAGNWSETISTTLGLAVFSIGNADQLSNVSVPNGSRGNTRDEDGAPVAEFNPVYLDAGVTYTLERFPFYRGAFPVSVSADYLNNPAVSKGNEGYSVGVSFGRASKKGTWELAYRWLELQPDAWFEELPESDFGAYYQAQQANAGFGTSSNPLGRGYGPGTNVRGHWFRLAYAPFDSLTLGATGFLTELIDENPPGSASGMTRIQIDAVWKF